MCGFGILEVLGDVLEYLGLIRVPFSQNELALREERVKLSLQIDCICIGVSTSQTVIYIGESVFGRLDWTALELMYPQGTPRVVQLGLAYRLGTSK